ncbi:Uncharacterised protein [Priestia megaterium]|uniref:RES family NAD+ phosphorylase n=1 Tax=Priestia megaterium TaxID=1404 RepID=UPI000E185EEC|nr:RES family NAD+ phosphorylase [Priestia megaterium]SUV06335.1 Uncharacterised protein [Priestia megaterium]
MTDQISCLSCLNIQEQLEYNDLTLYDIENPPVSIVGFNEDIICEVCSEELEPETYYIYKDNQEELFEKIGEKLGEVISEQIEYCSNCEGSAIEYQNYVYEKEFGEAYNSGIDVYDFLCEYNIFDDYLMDYVIKNLVCKHCGFGVPDRDDINRYFDTSDRIYSRQEIDKFYGLDVEELNIIGEIYGISFTREELNDFINFIYNNPSLSMKHEAGQKIYELLEKNLLTNDYVLHEGTTLFRGRKRYHDQNKYDEKSLWTPPQGQASHGRYNSIGISVLYCSDGYKGLPYELSPLKNECIDYVEFILNTNLQILDISKLFPEEFGEYISTANVESKLLKKTYLFTNFISSCCKDIGYDGIRYKGVSDKEEYYNFALFNGEGKSQFSIKNINTLNTDIFYKLSSKNQ